MIIYTQKEISHVSILVRESGCSLALRKVSTAKYLATVEMFRDYSTR